MEPDIFYNQHIAELQGRLKVLLQRKRQLAWLRFAVIVSMIIAVYLLLPYDWLYISLAVILPAVLFTRLVLADLKNKNNIEHTQRLIEINEDEIRALQHNYHHFDEGNQYFPAEHYYANDLDIFGKASLFQYINRTTSEMGSTVLADWLLNPADNITIQQRQAAIRELNQQTEWRQNLQALGKKKKIQLLTRERLQAWLNEENTFIKHRYLAVLRYIIPAIVLLAILLSYVDFISATIQNYTLLASAIFAFVISKKATILHYKVSKIVDELEVMSDAIQAIERATFNTPFLSQLQSAYLHQNNSASRELAQLKKILERFDMRYNIVIFIPLDILLQWDLQQVIALEKWKQRNSSDIIQWFNTLGQFEAINSLSTLSFNHPEWVFPQLQDKHFFIEGKDVGHPLINKNKRVNNSIHINDRAEIMLITGSNMAGKSTYLRSIGINVVLTMAGASVCASYFKLSPVQLISSMRIADNLEESTSTFYAELKKLKVVIDNVNKGAHVFILLDEILRGTNSLDRHTGSVALIKQLIRERAAAIIATHDVELAKLKNTYPDNILNYHFDVQVNKEELYFDYELKPGICNSLNASILMKKIGIEL